MKTISENIDYSEYIRDFAKDFFKGQDKRNQISSNIKKISFGQN